MPIEYDPFLVLIGDVVETLTDSEPLLPKEIASKLRKAGRGRISADSINKVLTQYLKGQVVKSNGGRWGLVVKPKSSK